MKRICVFCGANKGFNSIYMETAAFLGAELVGRGLGLVYGGASVGLMGACADAVMEAGGEVIGVIPQSLVNYEVAHPHLNDLRVVETMHERKALMAELSDGIIALPGGWGTLDEMFETLTWAQLGFHAKPCGFLDPNGYYDLLLQFLDNNVEQGFVTEEHRAMVLVDRTPSGLLDQFSTYQAPKNVRKWMAEKR